MLNLKKSLRLAGAIALALGAAVPVMTTAASAAPSGHYDVERVAQNDRSDFRGMRHDQRFEHHAFMRHGWKHCRHEFRKDRDR